MVKKKLKIGQKVFVISRKLEIEEKEVLAIIDSGGTTGYTLDKNSCGGYEEKDVFKTEAEAEVTIQDFRDKLRFAIGELIVFEYEEYSKQKKAIGRIVGITMSDSPYEINGTGKEFDSICEEQILLRIKNKFIENYGNLKELFKEFDEKEKETRNILNMIYNEYDKLEDEINDSVRRQYSIMNWNKSKPKFEDRFTYEERDYYD